MGRYDILLQQDSQEEKLKTRPAQTKLAQHHIQRIQEELEQGAKDNELKEAAFSKPQTTQPKKLVLPVRPVLPAPPVRGAKRTMKQRHPFDIYQDQYESLQ